MKFAYLILALGFAIWAASAKDLKDVIVLAAVWLALMIGFHAEEIKETIRRNR